MNPLHLNTYNAPKPPNTKLTIEQLKDLEDTLDAEPNDPAVTREVAETLLKNATNQYIDFELRNAISMIGKDKLRSINSVLYSVIMKSVPMAVGGRRKSRRKSSRKTKKSMRRRRGTRRS